MSARIFPNGTPAIAKLRALTDVGSGGCHIWTGTLNKGYGRVFDGVWRWAHRVAYEAYVGPIPDGMTVDHLCFNPPCVNPDHLRLLTRVQNCRNQRRAFKTECVNGHEFTPENTKYQTNRRNPAGPKHRFCAECRRDSDRRRRAA